MDNDDGRWQNRKRIRLNGYDYATPNYYFITICTNEKKCIFGKARDLNALGKIAEKGFLMVADHFPFVEIHKFTVMPNHVHAIVILSEKDINLSTVIGCYKAFVSREIHKMQPDLTVWQRSFHDHIIRDRMEYEKIWNYIDTNPVKWEEDCFFQKPYCFEKPL